MCVSVCLCLCVCVCVCACVRVYTYVYYTGTIKHLDLSNTDNITGDALIALCEEHGESLESLVLTTTPRIHVPDITQVCRF